MNFPGHNYLGPGNPIHNGKPVDEDDRIAQIHDTEYDNATSSADIRSADRSAISAFTKDFVFTGNYHSAIGGIGLGLKYIGESVFGVQYPRNIDSRKRTVADMSGANNPVDGLDEPDSKRAKRHGDNEEMEISAAAQRESNTRSIQSNTKAIGHGINIHHPISNFKTGKLTFVHQRLMYTKGYQFKTLASTVKLGHTVQNLLTTPFARVPCDVLPWYLTKTEFDTLPIGSSVKLCTTIVSPLGFRTPFLTNSSGLNSVNSNLFVLGMSAHGLNNTFHGVNMKYTITADKPCVPSGVQFDEEDDWDHWWGTPITNVDTGKGIFNLEQIPTIVGNMHAFRQYYCQNYLALNEISPFPELMQKMHIYNLENGMNNPTAVWTYKPQLCVLKPQSPIQAFVNTDAVIGYGVKPIGFRKYKLNVDGGKTTGDVTLGGESGTLGEMVPTYYSYIEHIGSAAHGFAEFGGMFMPPSLHVGVLPVHSYSTTPTNDDIQDITVVYKVDTIMEIEYSYDFILPYDTRGNAHCLYTGDTTYITQHANTVNANP